MARERIIYSNYDVSEAYEEAKKFLMEEYPELCDCEVTHKDGSVTMEPSDSRIWNEVNEEDEITWTEVYRDLKKFFDGKTVIFFGSVGTWRGNFPGGKVGDFEDLFNKAASDCDYVEFKDIDGHMYLQCSHHDGTNNFEIKILSQKGEDFMQNWEDGYYYYNNKRYDYPESEMHRKLITNNFLSYLPHFIKQVWGC